MSTLSLRKDKWAGNHWPSVEIHPYEYEEFLKVVSHLCAEFQAEMPSIVDILDGYAADLWVGDDLIMIHMDNWTFSIATERTEFRDKIFEVLKTLDLKDNSE